MLLFALQISPFKLTTSVFRFPVLTTRTNKEAKHSHVWLLFLCGYGESNPDLNLGKVAFYH